MQAGGGGGGSGGGGGKSPYRGVCGTQSLVCSLNVKAISSSTSSPFETGAILSKAGKLFRRKKNIAQVAVKKIRGNAGSQSSGVVSRRQYAAAFPFPKMYRHRGKLRRAVSEAPRAPRAPRRRPRLRAHCKLRFKQLRYNSTLFCFWPAILVFVKKLFFSLTPKGLKTFLIYLIRSRRPSAGASSNIVHAILLRLLR